MIQSMLPKAEQSSCIITALSNGTSLIVIPEPASAVVTTTVVIASGFADDPPGLSGSAHVAEHVIFKPAPRNDFSQTIIDLGGATNAVTERNLTVFESIVPAESRRQLIKAEATRFGGRCAVDPATFEAHRRTVIEEISSRGRSPISGFPWAHMAQALDPLTTILEDGFGDIDEVERMSARNCESFLGLRYLPHGGVIAVAGPIDAERTIEEVENSIAQNWRAPSEKEADEPSMGSVGTQRNNSPILVQVERSSPGPILAAIGWYLPNAATDPRGYCAAAVLGELITETASRDRNMWTANEMLPITMVTGFRGTSLSIAHNDLGVAMTALGTEVPVARFTDFFLEQLQLHADAGFTPSDLVRAKKRCATRYYLNDDRLLNRATGLARSQALFEATEVYSSLGERFAEVLPNDIAAQARAIIEQPWGSVLSTTARRG
ncbi:M16 family metallopeptidase [Arthrobacter sp. Z1-15]